MKYRRARPPRGNGLQRNRRQLQLLRKDSCVIKDSAFRAKYADIFEKQTSILSWTWRIYGIQYVKVDIRTNKPLNVLVRLRLSFSVSLMDWQQTPFIIDSDFQTKVCIISDFFVEPGLHPCLDIRMSIVVSKVDVWNNSCYFPPLHPPIPPPKKNTHKKPTKKAWQNIKLLFLIISRAPEAKKSKGHYPLFYGISGHRARAYLHPWEVIWWVITEFL